MTSHMAACVAGIVSQEGLRDTVYDVGALRSCLRGEPPFQTRLKHGSHTAGANRFCPSPHTRAHSIRKVRRCADQGKTCEQDRAARGW